MTRTLSCNLNVTFLSHGSYATFSYDHTRVSIILATDEHSLTRFELESLIRGYLMEALAEVAAHVILPLYNSTTSRLPTLHLLPCNCCFSVKAYR